MTYVISDDLKKKAKLLLEYIIEYYGGYAEVGAKTNSVRQRIYTYIVYGYVPLSNVYTIAKPLKVSVWALSYVKLAEVFGEQSPSFEKVVNDLKFLDPKIKARLLKGK